MRRLVLQLLGIALIAGSAGNATAEKPSFGPHDLPTVFFINKSDDHNRVDYGIRLDAECRPVGNEAVFPYWREFEDAPPVRTHPLGWWEYTAYGISEQGPSGTGNAWRVKLKRLPRSLLVTITRNAAGKCVAVATANVSGVVDAEVVSAFAKLRSVVHSVEYVEIHGRDPRTGAMLTERLTN